MKTQHLEVNEQLRHISYGIWIGEYQITQGFPVTFGLPIQFGVTTNAFDINTAGQYLRQLFQDELLKFIESEFGIHIAARSWRIKYNSNVPVLRDEPQAERFAAIASCPED